MMTQREALMEAVRRWGKNAAVHRAKRSAKGPRGTIYVGTHRVGVIRLGLFFSIQGEGSSWEEAFAKADKKESAEW
ncbi:MAG: hypothetical protein ABID40_02800 [Candidatus Bipolaricaulota bacterium]